MTNAVLVELPEYLRAVLFEEYNGIVKSFLERRWRPSELSGGRFCEIVYTILNGHAIGRYPTTLNKPLNFVNACRGLEQNSNEPRSFQILIPRMLPALYEIRNSRNVGHIGGDVDPNHMDAVAVLSMANWIMAELVRVLHKLPSMEEAQSIVDAIADRRTPLVWQEGDVRRILDPGMKFPDQILVLLTSSAEAVTLEDLLKWIACSTKTYMKKLLRELHSKRMVEFDEQSGRVTILPPGTAQAERVLSKYA